MTIKAGKYQTRCGLQAVVLECVGGYAVGYYCGADGRPDAARWNAETGAYSEYEAVTCLDIMPPEPEIEIPDVGQLLAWFEGDYDEDAPRGVKNVAREAIKWDRARQAGKS